MAMHRGEKDNHRISILLVSTSYPAGEKDWRGRFIANIVEAIDRQEGIDLNVWAPPGLLPRDVQDVTSPTEGVWLKDLMVRGGIAHLLRTKGLGSAGIVIRLLFYLRKVFMRSTDVDILHINWLQNAMPLWGTKTPAVIAVLGSDFRLLRLRGISALLRAVLKQRRCIIAPNAGWMAPKLNSVFGDIAEIRPIPFGVDHRWFAIVRKPLESDSSRWIAVNRVTSEKIGPLFEWGQGVFGLSHEIHIIGPMQENVQLPDWVRYHGPASPDELEKKWFPEATGLVSLSQHTEGRPQVILEAMAARLPVVASNIPAHLDVIKHQSTGWIVTSPTEFRDAISLLNHPDLNARIGKAARKWVIENIGTWDDCVNRYADAYHDLMDGNL